MFVSIFVTIALEQWQQPVEYQACENEGYGEWGTPDEAGRVPVIPFDGAHFGAIFPSEAFDGYSCTWYARFIDAMDGESLPITPNGRIIRFTWLRTFHAPIMFRADVSSDPPAGSLTWTMNDGAGGYSPGRIEEIGTRQLPSASVQELIELADHAQLCGNNDADEIGLDGAEWIFEDSTNERYCASSFWSPHGTTEYELGVFMIRLSDLDTGPIY